jgi:hypothetical protein
MIPKVTASEIGIAHSRIPLSLLDGSWKLWRWELPVVTVRSGYATPLDCGLPIAGERPIVVTSLDRR